MDDEFETLKGRDAQKHIVEKAIEVAERVRSTLGPLGHDKMLVDRMGDFLLSISFRPASVITLGK